MKSVNSFTIQKQDLTINLLIGGFSLISYLLCWILLDSKDSVEWFAQVAFMAAIVLNYPHFASSYLILYSDFKNQLKKNIRYIWAGVLVPALLLSYFSSILYFERGDLLAHSVNFMFFLLGWHLIKQTFGVIIVLSANKNYFYSSNEKNFLLINLFSVWAVSFIGGQDLMAFNIFYGLKIETFQLNEIWLNISNAVFYISFIAIIVLHYLKYKNEKTLPLVSSVIALVVLYTWLLPALIQPHFMYLATAFHALQYFVFVYFFKKNKNDDQLQQQGIFDYKKITKKKLFQFFGLAFVLGLIFLHLIPSQLDSLYKMSSNQMGTNTFMAIFFVFVNIHHYYIDNVIWRSANPEMKKYLFLTHDH